MTDLSARTKPSSPPSPVSAIIMVVEDDVLIRMMVADELRHQTYTVVAAATAHEAMTILEGGTSVDLVRFALESGHVRSNQQCPLWAKTGLVHCNRKKDPCGMPAK